MSPVLAVQTEGNALENGVRNAVDYVVPVIEAIGALVVLSGALLAIGLFVGSTLRLRTASYEEVRLSLGRHLALGLEFQLGADILSTAVSPTWNDLGKLGAIAAIRTALNFFLQRELAEEDRRVSAAQAGHAGQAEQAGHAPA